MLILTSIFAILLVVLPVEPLKVTHCAKLLHHLATTQGDFMHCATTHAVPVTICVGCISHYNNTLQSFDTLKTDCSDTYFDKDRLNLVESTQYALTSIWKTAFCDDCFQNNCEQIFVNKSNVLNDCLNFHKGQECELCNVDYIDLNEFFIQQDQYNNGKVCFDMQDEMNRTRINWSKTLKCCQRVADRTFFVVASSLICMLPIIFYGGMYALTKRRERNHELLLAEDEETETVPSLIANAIAQRSSTQATQNVPDEPMLNINTQVAKKNHLQNDSDDSSEVEDNFASKKST